MVLADLLDGASGGMLGDPAGYSRRLDYSTSSLGASRISARRHGSLLCARRVLRGGRNSVWVAIRYLGFSMTYALSIGISCVLGTLLPPLLASQLGGLLQRTGSAWVFSGIAIATAGIFASGVAGKLRDTDQAGSMALAVPERSGLKKGLFFAFVAGVLSAVFGLALAAGQPIADVAARYGAGKFQGNVILIFACGGAFVSTAIFCLYLHWKDSSLREYVSFADGPARNLLGANFGLGRTDRPAVVWAVLLLYGMAHTYMGLYRFTSWGAAHVDAGALQRLPRSFLKGVERLSPQHPPGLVQRLRRLGRGSGFYYLWQLPGRRLESSDLFKAFAAVYFCLLR